MRTPRESTEWKLEHATFDVVVRCTDRYPGGARQRLDPGLARILANQYGWCLYAVIRPGHPFWEAVSAPNEESYEFGVPELDRFMHGGCTFLERDPEEVTIGCDYSHHNDDNYMRTRPDGDCAVHQHAAGLEELLLLAERALTSDPAEWPLLVTTYQDEYPTLVGHLTKKLAD